MTDKTIRRGWRWVPSLYFAEGLPYVVVMTIAGIMYTRLGVSNTEMAFYTSWLMLPWLIKPLWSPIVDILSTKRRWVVVMQWAIAAALGAVAFGLPGAHYFKVTMAAFFVIAFLSATHDIAADGFYMIGLDTRGQSFFVGIRTTFYRAAMLFCQGPVVMAAGYLEESGDVSRAWELTFYGLSLLFLVIALYNSFAMPHSEQLKPDMNGGSKRASLRAIVKEFGQTFAGFFKKSHIAAALLFMILYKLPEAQLIKLINPFLLHPAEAGGLGLTTKEVGVVYGTVGVIGLLLGGIVGGMVVSHGGLRRWIMPMAWSMSLTCLSFVYLAWAPWEHTLTDISLCVFTEQFGYGFGGTAYILYLINFSQGPFKTSHYAICTGFMTLGSMLPGMAAGWIEEQMGYANFFLWTMVCCVATIAVARSVKSQLPAEAGEAGGA
ncbi:MAG: MFS transporter [Firmicutes bacterium]|nr:MFS transporter [Bacillota bacterium]MCM1402100.1 MFS transporter [Bacteroides sp.]MCM1477969.1 MFS transporter [Bacteroides sp.]